MSTPRPLVVEGTATGAGSLFIVVLVVSALNRKTRLKECGICERSDKAEDMSLSIDKKMLAEGSC
jgi:hypothetical protein